MRVLMLLTDAYGGHGGIALYNRDVIRAASACQSITAIDVVPRIAGPYDGTIPEKVRWRANAAGNALKYVASAVMASIGLGKRDIIWCAHANLLPIAAIIARLTSARLILAIYGTEAWDHFESRPARRFLGAVDEVVSISQVTADRFQKWSGFPDEKVSIIANAIDLSLYGEAPRDPVLVARYGLAEKRTVMIFGRMHPTERQKGFDELIEAMPDILAHAPDAVLLLAGDGDDRPRLEAVARESGAADSMRFVGRVAEEEKAAHYRLADAYVMPGRQEGFGFVHLEAMACGTPSVASIADGSIEAVMHGEIGGLVDPGDRASIVRETLAALSRPRGIPPALTYFSFDRFAREVAVVLEQTGQRTRPSGPRN